MKLKKLIEDNFKNLGMIKAVINHTRNDLGYGTFLMMLWICLERGIDWYYFLIIPAYMIFKLKDMNIYHGQETEYNFWKCPPVAEQYKMIKEIHEKLIIPLASYPSVKINMPKLTDEQIKIIEDLTKKKVIKND